MSLRSYWGSPKQPNRASALSNSLVTCEGKQSASSAFIPNPTRVGFMRPRGFRLGAVFVAFNAPLGDEDPPEPHRYTEYVGDLVDREGIHR
jgi:hypothetical protein